MAKNRSVNYDIASWELARRARVSANKPTSCSRSEQDCRKREEIIPMQKSSSGEEKSRPIDSQIFEAYL